MIALIIPLLHFFFMMATTLAIFMKEIGDLRSAWDDVKEVGLREAGAKRYARALKRSRKHYQEHRRKK